jgi:hypothetical protein
MNIWSELILHRLKSKDNDEHLRDQWVSHYNPEENKKLALNHMLMIQSQGKKTYIK